MRCQCGIKLCEFVTIEDGVKKKFLLHPKGFNECELAKIDGVYLNIDPQLQQHFLGKLEEDKEKKLLNRTLKWLKEKFSE